jgi:hypothetical protein
VHINQPAGTIAQRLNIAANSATAVIRKKARSLSLGLQHQSRRTVSIVETVCDEAGKSVLRIIDTGRFRRGAMKLDDLEIAPLLKVFLILITNVVSPNKEARQLPGNLVDCTLQRIRMQMHPVSKNAALLESAVQLHCPVGTAAISYALDHGSVADEVCYWRNMTLVPRLLGLFFKREIRSICVFSPAKIRTAVASRSHENCVRKFYRCNRGKKELGAGTVDSHSLPDQRR